MSIQVTIIVTAIVLWFATGWYMNEKLRQVHAKLDNVLNQFEGLRRYLYEIDPQFNDERISRQEFEEAYASGDAGMTGAFDSFLIQGKKKAGKRTLGDTFLDWP